MTTKNIPTDFPKVCFFKGLPVMKNGDFAFFLRPNISITTHHVNYTQFVEPEIENDVIFAQKSHTLEIN